MSQYLGIDQLLTGRWLSKLPVLSPITVQKNRNYFWNEMMDVRFSSQFLRPDHCSRRRANSSANCVSLEPVLDIRNFGCPHTGPFNLTRLRRSNTKYSRRPLGDRNDVRF